jgi:hypothetical protein
MRNVFIAAAAALLLGGASTVSAQPAPASSAPPQPPSACFFPRDVIGFSAPNDHTVYFRVGPSDYYQLDLMTPCSNLNWSDGLALQNRSGGPTICSPTDAEVVVRLKGQFTDHCPVQAMRKLTQVEVQALGKNRP